jgi:ABC-type multidrug transport system fused ATPase/permease subunit
VGQTLCEFAFIAGLGFLQSRRALLPLVAGSLLARLAMGVASTRWVARLGGLTRREVQENLWSFTVSKTGHDHAQRGPARHQRVLTQAPTDAAAGIVVPAVQASADLTTLFVLEAAIAIWSPVAGLIALLVVSALGAGAMWSIAHGSGRASVKEAQALEAAHHLSWDVTHGARDILINDATRIIQIRSVSAARSLEAATRAYLTWTSGQRAALEGVSLALVGVLSMAPGGRTGGLIAGIAVLRLIPILSRVGGAASQLKNATSRTNAWSETLMAALPKAVTPDSVDDTSSEPPPGVIVSVDIRPGSRTERRMRSPVRFDVRKGDWLQIVGESGAGKSSVLDAIAGLWTEFDGEIRRNGLSRVGYASQSPFLLAGRLGDNILLGRDLDLDALESAAKTAGLPECFGLGYKDFLLFDRGTNISGGQRQRVSIARAIIGRPDLLILDEATANLDRDAEEAILRRIRLDLPEAAVIVVTHRMTPVPWELDRVAM